MDTGRLELDSTLRALGGRCDGENAEPRPGAARCSSRAASRHCTEQPGAEQTEQTALAGCWRRRDCSADELYESHVRGPEEAPALRPLRDPFVLATADAKPELARAQARRGAEQ